MSTPIPSIAVHLLSGVHEQFGEAENAHLHPPRPRWLSVLLWE